MLLLLLLLTFLGLNALAAWCGADSRDGRDWTPVRPGPRLGYDVSMTGPSHDHLGMAMPCGTRAFSGEYTSTSSTAQRM